MDWIKILGLPELTSVHGAGIDAMIGWVHVLMVVLFIGWGSFFLYLLVRFRASRNARASYYGAKGHSSSYLEVGIAVAEAVLLLGFAIPIWGMLKTDFPQEKKATVVRVIAEQFAWNIHYPGPDGIFGKTDVHLVDETNPIGLDRSDPSAKDDLVRINELRIPLGKPAVMHISSKDVIHSFALQEMRIKQDAIPGMSIPVWFTPSKTGNWEISCAQLCGLGHYRMRGFFYVMSDEDYENWMEEQLRKLS